MVQKKAPKKRDLEKEREALLKTMKQSISPELMQALERTSMFAPKPQTKLTFTNDTNTYALSERDS